MLHIGHINIFKNAKKYCGYLLVAVSTDEVVEKNKNKKPIIPFKDRFEIVSSIKYVDEVVSQDNYDIQGKIDAVKKYNVDVVFVGSDWKNTKKWDTLEKELKLIGCDVVYLPHTEGISSSLLREIIRK